MEARGTARDPEVHGVGRATSNQGKAARRAEEGRRQGGAYWLPSRVGVMGSVAGGGEAKRLKGNSGGGAEELARGGGRGRLGRILGNTGDLQLGRTSKNTGDLELSRTGDSRKYPHPLPYYNLQRISRGHMQLTP